MAKATSETVVTGVTLEIVADEAKALAAALNYVTGSTISSPAKHIQSVLYALTDFDTWSNPYMSLVRPPLYGGAGIRFDDFKAAKGNS